MGLASNLSLYSATSLHEAMQMTPDIAMQFFNGKPFDDWKKSREIEWKTQSAIVDRLNNTIRAINTVAKNLSKIR